MHMWRFFIILCAAIASLNPSMSEAATHPRRLGFPDQCFECLECTVAESALVVRATVQPDLSAVVTETIKGSATVGSQVSLGGYADSYSPGEDVLLLWHGTTLWRCYALDGQSVVM